MTPMDVEAMVDNLDARVRLVEQILPTLATKEDLKAFATKEDLKAFATKEELQATNDEVKALAAAMEMRSGRCSQVKAAWKPAMRSAHSSGESVVSPANVSSPASEVTSPSAGAAVPRTTERSMPAEKARPSPRTTTTRTPNGRRRIFGGWPRFLPASADRMK